jgi:C7-cyclitol 7-kinase
MNGRAHANSLSPLDATTSIIVYDIGGTTIRAGVYETSDDVVSRIVRSSTWSRWVDRVAAAEDLQSHLILELARLADSLDPSGELPLAVAFPGPVDERGNVLAAPTIWGGWGQAPVPIAALLKDRCRRNVLSVMNDVTAAGYYYRGSAGPDFCIVTVSSGIGHKLFVGGHPVLGPSMRGGEMGHWRVSTAKDAPKCECGGYGHLGAISSGRGTLMAARRKAIEAPDDFATASLYVRCGGQASAITNDMIADAFRADDRWTQALIEETSFPLGQMLGAVHLIAGTEEFLLIGGFAVALGERYRRMVAAAAARCAWDDGVNWNDMVKLGSFDDSVNLVGVGRMASEHLKK